MQQDLHLIGVEEDGTFLLLQDDSGAEYRLRLDDAVRRAVRREVHPMTPDGTPAPVLGPRQVQAMIRAGASPEEAAERAGWTVEKVHRYDGPILAEREHIATTAGKARLRGRSGEQGRTLAERVHERLTSRGVNSDAVVWDSWRSEDGQWTVVVSFPAGGRVRQASWAFSRQTTTVRPLDDEALWLSGDDDVDSEPNQPLDALLSSGSTARGHRGGSPIRSRSTTVRMSDDEEDDPFDLMDSVRQHSDAGHRRSGRGRAPRVDVTSATASDNSPSALPPVADALDRDATPLAPLGYDPQTMQPPPGAHSDPQPDGPDGRPEPAAARAALQGGNLAEKAAKVPTPRPVRRTKKNPADQKSRSGSATNSGRRRRPASFTAPTATPDPDTPIASPRTSAERAASDRQLTERPAAVERSTTRRPAMSAAAPERTPAAPTAADEHGEAAPPRPRSRAKGRASVPSWDDIMFGGGHTRE